MALTCGRRGSGSKTKDDGPNAGLMWEVRGVFMNMIRSVLAAKHEYGNDIVLLRDFAWTGIDGIVAKAQLRSLHKMLQTW